MNGEAVQVWKREESNRRSDRVKEMREEGRGKRERWKKEDGINPAAPQRFSR